MMRQAGFLALALMLALAACGKKGNPVPPGAGPDGRPAPFEEPDDDPVDPPT